MTENVSEAKSRLRTQVLTNRSQGLASNTASEIGSQLLVLCSKLGARSVGIYLSFGSEPVTDVFVIGAKAAGITLFAPRTGPESTMEFAALEGATESSELGFLQPIGEVIEPEQLDLIIAPALSVDAFGNRLGRGGGFFDRYLEKFEGPVAAVVYEHELVPELPNEVQDRPVQYAITPTGILALSPKR
jgi:5-formyltetrahydrofolate cyclo-ligase